MNLNKVIPFLILSITSLSCSNAQKVEFSKEALEEKIITVNQNEISFQEVLNQNKGKVILIEIWASWCGDCVKAMPKLKELQSNNSTVSYIFMSMDKTYEKWTDGIEKHQLKGSHYLINGGMKGNFGKALDLDWIPRYIIIDRTGKIVLYRAIETDFEKINTTLKSLN